MRDVAEEGELCLTPFDSPTLDDLLNTIERHHFKYDATIKKIDQLHLLATQKVNSGSEFSLINNRKFC